MSLQINRRFCAILLLVGVKLSTFAISYTESNPGEVAAVYTGEATLNSMLASQDGAKTAIITELSLMTKANYDIKKWERSYNQYLTSAGNFASAVIGASSIYAEGVRTLFNLTQVAKAVEHNPQGPFASIAMTDLYMQVGTEFIETYKLIKLAEKTGVDGMSSGADRVKMIWYISKKLEMLNSKLHKLALSFAVYSFEDVWNQATAGMLQKDHGQLAQEAQRRMQRAALASIALAK